MVLFGRYPGEWRKILDDPSKIPGAVEETLRFWAPSQYQGRVLTDDVTADGVAMAKGSCVLLLTAAANRDDREYADADTFDVDRTTHVALGFGYGLHFCLGAALARLEGRIGLEEFAVSIPPVRDRRDASPPGPHEQRARLRRRAVRGCLALSYPNSRDSPTVHKLSYFRAIVIGLFQGITELFPVSSLGHSVLIVALLGWTSLVKAESGESFFLAFLVALHVGTALALFVYFWRDWFEIIGDLGRSVRQRRVVFRQRRDWAYC